nr:hypothetical protein [Tanacetum cinerariifolium]
NRPAFYNNGDDDDDDCTIAITPDFLITDSLIMGDEHLDTILEKESDEFIKSSIENLVPNPTEIRLLDHGRLEKSSGSTTTHADNSLPEYDSFLFEIEPDQGELTSIVMEDILGEPHVHVPNVLPTHPTFMLDSDFIPSDDSLGSDLEVSFPSGTRNKIFDSGIFFEDCPDFEDSRASGFVHRLLELLSLACLYMGIRYPRSY